MKKIVSLLLAVIFLTTGLSVNVSAATVKINKSKKTLYVGDTFTLKLKNAPKDATITWKSSKKSVATVDAKGVVSAKKKGKATITAKLDEKTYKCKITVKNKEVVVDEDGVISAAFSLYKKAQTGDIITFGTYEQDGNKENGEESIEWVVLSNDGSELFVVSKYVLEWIQFNGYGEKAGWEGSELREWLNGLFFNNAFNRIERELIKTTQITNEKTYQDVFYSKEGYSESEEVTQKYDTKDKVFILSLSDVTNSTYGFDKDDSKNDINRRCKASKHVLNQGIVAEVEVEGEDCFWWLRSPTEHSCYHFNASEVNDGRSDYAYCVSLTGKIILTTDDAITIDKMLVGVRPAMIIDLTKEIVINKDTSISVVQVEKLIKQLKKQYPKYTEEEIRCLVATANMDFVKSEDIYTIFNVKSKEELEKQGELLDTLMNEMYDNMAYECLFHSCINPKGPGVDMYKAQNRKYNDTIQISQLFIEKSMKKQAEYVFNETNTMVMKPSRNLLALTITDGTLAGNELVQYIFKLGTTTGNVYRYDATELNDTASGYIINIYACYAILQCGDSETQSKVPENGFDDIVENILNAKNPIYQYVKMLR